MVLLFRVMFAVDMRKRGDEMRWQSRNQRGVFCVAYYCWGVSAWFVGLELGVMRGGFLASVVNFRDIR